MNRLTKLDWTSFVLLIVGGLNWGLIGLFNFNLVTAIFGAGTLSSIVFTLVGLASIYSIYSLTKIETMSSLRPSKMSDERMNRAA